jgi:hypothetical protein
MHRLSRRALLISGVLSTTSMGAMAQNTPAPVLPAAPAAAPAAGAPTACVGTPDPYTNFNCLDPYLGDNPFVRLYNYYKLEWGQSGPPVDPNAPPSRAPGYHDTSVQSTPPMPFTEWPYGGVTPIGVTRTGSIDSPLMNAISNTTVGQWLNSAGIQIYGWVDPGGNFSSNTLRKPGGNAPINYAYIPNTLQLDQAVIYFDRFPDTVQKDHIDWGFRISAIYGENYRYTQSYGLGSWQFNGTNQVNGFDMPMIYGELYIPFVLDGLMVRVGRYISLPDIEAQLAPNNYMYTHSFTYGYDNYTNEGVQLTLAVNPNLMLQFGVSAGTEAQIWNYNKTRPNLAQTVTLPSGATIANPLYSGSTFKLDPGLQPSFTACVRVQWNEGKDNLYPCVDALNNGQWGYNNLQWYGFTYYHKFNDQWHISYELYDLVAYGVPNTGGSNPNPAAVATFQQGGTPFSPQFLAFNPPNGANCHNVNAVRCNTSTIGTTFYLAYSPDPLNNITLRPEIYYDPQGFRTGTAATYTNISLGWQHWFSPQVEMRPEVGYYRSHGNNAFNGGTRNYTYLVASDLIWHF